MRTLKVILIALAALLIGTVAFGYSGLFNVAADKLHWTLTAQVLGWVRERSIERHASNVNAPSNLEGAGIIAAGARTTPRCAPTATSLQVCATLSCGRGCTRSPPKLAEHGAHREPTEAFWIIKHGLKMTGMPAWGATHDDERIWAKVAFLRALPALSSDDYRKLTKKDGVQYGEEGDANHHQQDQGGESVRAWSSLQTPTNY